MRHFSLAEFPVERKKVLVRVDYNVPIDKGKVRDDTKIRASLPTMEYLLQRQCTIILATHFGHPEGKIVPELRVNLLAHALQKMLPKQNIITFDDCIGRNIKERITVGKPKEVFLLENLRFYKEEEENDAAFAHSLANLADIYVNDAFAVAHRKHASVDAITRFLPAAAGFLMETEIEQLGKALHPEQPAVWIMGGAKLNKIELLQQALHQADYILIGGALAFSFLKAKHIQVGMSKIDSRSLMLAQKILQEKLARKIILPIDFMVTDKFSAKAPCHNVHYNHIKPQEIALDLGPETIKLFKIYLRKAKTIVWNGPLGYFEWAKYAASTKEIGRFLGRLTATTIAGGGETAEALHKFHLADNLTHVSTGGGATLEFLAGKKLPAIEALERNYRMFKGKL